MEVEDGSLTINSKGSGWFTIVNDPWRPTPSDGGHLGPNPGKFNRGIIDKRLDVGVFQTNSFEKEIMPSLKSGRPVMGRLTKGKPKRPPSLSFNPNERAGTGEGDGSESQEQEWEFHLLRPSDFLTKPND